MESEPWAALLVVSKPNKARKLFGLSIRAFSESVGPSVFLQLATADGANNSIARTGPDEM